MKNNIARSPLFYVGDKFKLISEIRQYFPENINRFIEPFVGGGSVFMNVQANSYLLNDIDKNVISIHKYLNRTKKETFFKKFFGIVEKYGLTCSYKGYVAPKEIKKQFPKTYYAHINKEAYNKLKEDYNNSNRRNICMLYVLLIYGFNRILRFNKQGNFNLPVGDVDYNKNANDALEDYFRIVNGKDIKWYSLDFKKFINSIDFTENDFVYLDPPYLITFSEYNKLWNEETEKELLDILDELDKKKVKFAISNVTHYKGKTNDIFIEWAAKYQSHSIKSNYISFNDNSIKDFNEVLITNF